MSLNLIEEDNEVTRFSVQNRRDTTEGVNTIDMYGVPREL